ALLAKERSISADLSEIPAPAGHATLDSNGDAIPPANAPLAVRGVIEAANQIDDLPYIWGGGHGSFTSSGYDCSGAVSFALHGGGLLSSPLDSTGLEVWGVPGGGNWITVFANSGHAWAEIAGLRWDTAGNGSDGPRWSTATNEDPADFVARHPAGSEPGAGGDCRLLLAVDSLARRQSPPAYLDEPGRGRAPLSGSY